MVRHSHEDALSEASFKQLVEAAKELEEPYDAECVAVLYLGGRLGLRAGEIAHVRESWVNREQKVIEVPRHSECRSGKNGNICGYCRKRAQSAVDHNEDLTMQEALENRWEPKTEKGVRAVPYDFDPGVEAVVEAFFEEHDSWPTARIGVNRRVDRVAEAANYSDRVYPHALRATAASWHASRGVPPAALQALMGWAQLAVADKYVRLTGTATSRALNEAHGD
jgi:integrase